MELLKEFTIKESYIKYKGTIYRRNNYNTDDSFAWFGKLEIYLDDDSDLVKELENEYQKLIVNLC